MPADPPNRPRAGTNAHPASLAIAAVQVAWLLERLSRGLSRRLFVAPTPLLPRQHHLQEARGLRLETPLRAALKPPREYVFIPEDEYYQDVERVLGSLR